MSMHKKPLTPTEEAGLRAHGLDIGTPSQLSDAFRQGVAWGHDAGAELCDQLESLQAKSAALVDALEKIKGLRLNGRHVSASAIIYSAEIVAEAALAAFKGEK